VSGLWRHSTRDITFCLIVDDFAVKYIHEDDAKHLLNALETPYQITTDGENKMYCGISLSWDYIQRTVDISMPGYVAKALQRFCHTPNTRFQNFPQYWTQPQYVAHQHMTPPQDKATNIDADGITRVKEIIIVFLFYGRAVDSTMMVALGTLVSQQSNSTYATAKTITQLLNYAATRLDATIRYISSDIYLHIHSNAWCLS
jgi:hypothetical protein